MHELPGPLSAWASPTARPRKACHSLLAFGGGLRTGSLSQEDQTFSGAKVKLDADNFNC